MKAFAPALLFGIALAQDTSALLGAATSILADATSAIDTGVLSSLAADATSVLGGSAIQGVASSLAGDLSSFAASVTRAATLSTTTGSSAAANTGGSYISFLVGQGQYTSGFAASIIGGDACHTTLFVACTEASGCGSGTTAVSSGVGVTITQGPSSQQFTTSTSTGGVQISLSGGCGITASTTATCTGYASLSANGQSTSTTSVSSYSAKYIQLTVTAGSIPTGSCTASGTGAAALPTAFVDVYKVIAVPVAMAAAAAFV